MSSRQTFLLVSTALKTARNGLTSHDLGVDDAAHAIANAFEIRIRAFDAPRFLADAGVPSVRIKYPLPQCSPPNPRSPGQLAYEAWAVGDPNMLAWADLHIKTRDSWEEAHRA